MPQLELLERASELAALTAALDDAAQGRGAIALVSGEAGIGKTALVTHFARRVADRVRTLWGACDPLLTPRPLGPLHDIARVSSPRLLAALGGSGGREAIFTAALDEVQRGKGATLCVIEDAHWADEATLDLLRFLGRRIANAPALIVVTYRDDEMGATHPLRAALGQLPGSALRRVRPAALSPVAVSRLARDAGQPATGLHEITGGNPFFVTEALAAGDGDVPPTVRDAVLARTARLSLDAQCITELASVVPMRTEGWLIEALLAPPTAALDECVSAGMVRDAEGALRFRHELARRAVEESLAPERRRQLHARCLDTLRRVGAADPARADVARLVHHAEGARDTVALRELAPLAAEQAAAAGAHREAVKHFARALRHTLALLPTERARLLERHAYECYLTDQMPEAIAARQEALRLWQTSGNEERAGETLRWLSRLHWFIGQRADAERYGREAVEVLERVPPGSALAMAYSNAAQLAMLADDVEGALLWGNRAIAIAEPLGDAATLSHALNNVGTAECVYERPGGYERLERALVIAQEHQLHEHIARAYTNLASTTILSRRLEAARRWLDEGIAFSTEHDLDSWVLYMRAWRAHLRFQTGEWDSAVDDACAVADNPRASVVSRIPALAVLARVRRHREHPGWEALLDETRALAIGADELQRREAAACARAEAAWLSGNGERTGDESAWAYPPDMEEVTPWRRAELTLWLWRAGRVAGPLDGVPQVVGLSLAGDWRAAAAEWKNIGSVVDQAHALADADEEGGLRQSLALFERIGSLAGATMVRRKLASMGARGVPRGSRPSTRAHPLGLTTRQQQILGLICDGLSNAEIAARLNVSEKTVDHHVSAVLAKLEVRSRAKAVAKAVALGLR